MRQVAVLELCIIINVVNKWNDFKPLVSSTYCCWHSLKKIQEKRHEIVILPLFKAFRQMSCLKTSVSHAKCSLHLFMKQNNTQKWFFPHKKNDIQNETELNVLQHCSKKAANKKMHHVSGKILPSASRSRRSPVRSPPGSSWVGARICIPRHCASKSLSETAGTLRESAILCLVSTRCLKP